MSHANLRPTSCGADRSTQITEIRPAGRRPQSAGAAASPALAGHDIVATDPPRLTLAARTAPITITTGDSRYTVIVQRGDTLWDLAQAWLGDPHRWTEIYQLNAETYDRNGRANPGGDHMRGGNHIEPTWHLRLPDDATPPIGAKPRTFIAPATGPAAPPAAAQPSAPTAPGDIADDGATDGDAPNQASRPASRTTDPAPSRPGESAPPGVTLTGDSWVDLGLALAVATAAAVVWRLRRRRYTPRPPGARTRLDDPDLAPLPPVVTSVRRALRAGAADHDDRHEDNDAGETSTASGLPDNGTPDDPESGEPRPLNLPALDNPMLAAWPPAGLGLTGPGAEAAARGFLTAALATGSHDPHGRGNVVVSAATLARLLGAAAVNVPDTPRLTVTGNLTEALELLEEQTLHRTRLVFGHEADTVAQLRETDPAEEPLPPILLLADATVSHERARISALLAQGQRLDIHGVLLGAWPDGNTVVVAGDGTTSPADGERYRHGSHPADVGRLTVINAAETAALLATLAESHTGLPQPPEPAEPRPRFTAAAASTTLDDEHAGSGGVSEADATTPDQFAATTPASDTASSPAADTETASPDHAQPAGSPPNSENAQDQADSDTDHGDGDGEGTGVVAVQVLGRPRIVGADPAEPLRAKALELLVYLIARDGGATIDAITEDLVPDAPLSKAPNRIHTYIYALRKALRKTGGRATYITHPRHRYQLTRAALDVDLWRMREALAAAETATGDARIAALRDAVAAYHGPFADGTRYEWAEPYREAARRQALDAHLALADALSDQPEQALAVLDTAIAHDPYAEELYQAAMRRHADLGDAAAITARLAELTQKLEELDTEPTDQSTELAGALTDDLLRRAHHHPETIA